MADLDRIKRNVGRLVDQGAPQEDVDAYIQGEGTSIDAIRAHKVGGPANVGTSEATLRNLNDTLSFGFYDPAVAHVKTLASQATGSKEPYWDEYRSTLNRERGRTQAAHSQVGPRIVGETAGMVGQALMTGGASIPEQIGARLAAPTTNALMQTMREAVPYGVAYGAAQGLGHTSGGSIGEQASGMVEGAIGGAVTAPLMSGAMFGVGQGINRFQQGREARKNAALANEQVLREAGITEPFPPAVSTNALMQPAARAVGSGLGGTPVAQGAANNVNQVQGSIARTLSAPLGGREAGDLGADIQGTLRRSIVERSKPGDEVRGADWERLNEWTGMSPPESYAPPPPKVKPAQPEPHQIVTPEMVMDEYRQSVRPVDPKPVYPDEKSFPLNMTPEGAARIEAVRNEAAMLRQKLDQEIGPNRDAATKAYYSEPVFKNTDFAKVRPLFDEAISMRPGSAEARQTLSLYFDPPSRPDRIEPTPNTDRLLTLYKNLHESDAQFRTAQERFKALDSVEIDNVGRDVRSSAQRAREAEIANARKQAELEAKRRAFDETEAAREQYAAQFKDRAEPTAQARTLQNQRIAEDNARKRTAEMQAEAERAHQQRLDELRARPDQEFKPGRTRESYATEFDAAYEAVRRTVPGLRYNPVEGRGLVGLLDDLGRTARRNKELPGYKNGEVFTPDGKLNPDLADHLRGQLGTKVVAAIEAHAAARSRGQANTDWWGAHELRTTARREAEQDWQHAARTGERHSVNGAALMRLQGALTQDIHGFLRASGKDGEAASKRLHSVDKAYREDMTSTREPLSKIFGEKVGSVEALDKLVKAGEKGDTRTLAAFMKVMHEKDDPLKGASAVLFHATNGGKDLGRLREVFAEWPQASRDIIFRGEQGQSLQRSLTTYIRAIDRLEPFLGTAKKTAGFSPASPTHLITLAGALAHWPTVIGLVGGNALVARWMASPRYLNWLTQMPAAARGGFYTAAFKSHLARLGALATSDRQNGVAVTEAFKEMLGIGQTEKGKSNGRP